MEYDKDKVDEMVLALLYLNQHHNSHGHLRTWKNMPWDAMDRLYEKGYIGDPQGRAKGVAMTEEGAQLSGELFIKHFGVEE